MSDSKTCPTCKYRSEWSMHTLRSSYASCKANYIVPICINQFEMPEKSLIFKNDVGCYLRGNNDNFIPVTDCPMYEKK